MLEALSLSIVAKALKMLVKANGAVKQADQGHVSG